MLEKPRIQRNLATREQTRSVHALKLAGSACRTCRSWDFSTSTELQSARRSQILLERTSELRKAPAARTQQPATGRLPELYPKAISDLSERVPRGGHKEIQRSDRQGSTLQQTVQRNKGNRRLRRGTYPHGRPHRLHFGGQRVPDSRS